MNIRKIALSCALLLTLPLAGCSQSGKTENTEKTDAPVTSTESAASESTDSGELTVFAAASLNTAFPQIAQDVFAKKYPHVKVNFSFEGSSSLAEKILAGADVDVFASADEKNMSKVKEFAPTPVTFTKNTLRLIVPTGNPAKITNLESVNGTKFVVCAPQVPCGRVTGELAKAKGITFQPVSEEQSVTDVRTKVESGEADAGLVYYTDALLAKGKVDIVDIPGMEDVGTSYQIAALSGSTHSDWAAAFLESVASPEGQKILATYGFGTGNGK
ncbi:molybdate ABC transporter substrate-binding protein [Trueperella sp. LYQ143]|uniref:molybdate ABC transporter substrate-binding protein n=1 Tax=Trueperella sp. LYQ143 TaxID=3391059 RepID=UPI003982DCBB